MASSDRHSVANRCHDASRKPLRCPHASASAPHAASQRRRLGGKAGTLKVGETPLEQPLSRVTVYASP